MLLPYRAKNPPERFPYVTLTLIIVNVLIYLFTSKHLLTVRDEAVGWLAVSHTTLSPWRILTAMFLHGSWDHIAGNMLFLWIFGASLEGRMKPLRFTALYFLSGYLASIISDLFTYTLHPDIANLGASGAIFGLAGAYLYVFPYSQIRVGYLYLIGFFPRIGAFNWQARWVVVYYLVINIIQQLVGKGNDGVGHLAHLGGAAAGLLGVWLMRIRRDTEDISAAQAVHADAKDLSLLSFYELEALMQRPSDNPELVLTYCEKALVSPGAGQPRCLDAINKNARVLLDRADPNRFALILFQLSPENFRSLPPVMFLRVATQLEKAYGNETAVRLYQKIIESAPTTQEAEVALFRSARLFEQTYGDKGRAAGCYQQIIERFPHGTMVEDAKRALASLGAVTPQGMIPGMPQASLGYSAGETAGARYDLAGNPLP